MVSKGDEKGHVESPHESDRKKIVRAAYNMLENRAGDTLSTAGALDSILQRARLESRIGWKPSDGIDNLVDIAKRKKAYHGTGRIKAGDIVLFHNVSDVNSNGKDDDWFCAAAVVVRSRGWRKVAVGKIGSMLKEIYLDPDDPHRRRLDNGTVVNSFLRKPSRSDHRFQMYLAGELLAGFIDIEELLDP